MEEKKEVIILAEEHPSNLRILASFGLNSAKKEIEEFSKNLIEVFTETYIRKIKYNQAKTIDSSEDAVEAMEIYTYVKGIEDAVEAMESSVDLYLTQQDIKLKEYEILDYFLSILPKDSTKLYVEGNREIFRERPEVYLLAKKYGIEVEFLDEGNPRYEKLEDENVNLLRNSSEIQIGRENYWVNKINTTIRSCKYAIAIVGRNHLRFSDEFIYRTSPDVQKEEGYFGEKLKELGYYVKIIDIIQLLPIDSKV
jgi:hypothetical protein